MRLSTGNQLSGAVSEVRHGHVTTIVKVTLGDSATVTSSTTREAAEELGLAPGDRVVVLIKSSGRHAGQGVAQPVTAGPGGRARPNWGPGGSPDGAVAPRIEEVWVAGGRPAVAAAGADMSDWAELRADLDDQRALLHAGRRTLFQRGDFTLRSGGKSDFPHQRGRPDRRGDIETIASPACPPFGRPVMWHESFFRRLL